MKLFLAMLIVLSTSIAVPASAQSYYDDHTSSSTPSNAQQNQIQSTDKGSIKVGFYTDPAVPDNSSQTKLYISFLNKDSGLIQQHIDYKVFIKKGQDQIFGTPVTHTAEGSLIVPFKFPDVGTYQILVEVNGILFQPIPLETATFTTTVDVASVPEFPNGIILLALSMISLITLYRMKFKS